jgi:acetylornithine deacetylase/succinyl-diaminopimelate desuccinylase-like protein
VIDEPLLQKLLRDLVAIDSVNSSLVPGARGEAAASEFLRDFLRSHGISAELHEAASGRPNVVALLGASASASSPTRPALAILAHIDTVGAGDMPDAFTPIERNGRLFGRGALDIKSGVAAMCAAAISLVRERATFSRPLLLAAVVDEECNSIGTEALLKEFSAGAAVVLEPTDLSLVIAHKGYAWFEIATHGRAAHGSLPAEGRDAIRMMGPVLGALDGLEQIFAARTAHPLLGQASLHASLISGGQELSSYPAECRLQLECRILPGESAADAESAFRKLMEGLRVKHRGFQATLRAGGSRPPYEISPEAPIARAAASAIREVTGSVSLAGMAAWTDTALLAAAGIPGVVFGPRGRGLHGAEEYVELDSVTECAEVLRRMIVSACCLK